MKKRGSLTPLFLIAMCAAAVWMYFTPYMAMNRLQKAAEAGDTEQLNELVDFPALRESVKQGVRTAVAREIGEESNPLARLGGIFAGALAGPVVDTFLSADGIAALSTGQRPDQQGGDAADVNGDGRPGDEDWKDRVRMDRGYESYSRFVVSFSDKETGDDRVSLVWKRDGLTGWKLTGVRLPAEEEAAAR